MKYQNRNLNLFTLLTFSVLSLAVTFGFAQLPPVKGVTESKGVALKKGEQTFVHGSPVSCEASLLSLGYYYVNCVDVDRVKKKLPTRFVFSERITASDSEFKARAAKIKEQLDCVQSTEIFGPFSKSQIDQKTAEDPSKFGEYDAMVSSPAVGQ